METLPIIPAFKQVEMSLEGSGKQLPPPVPRAAVKARHAALVWWWYGQVGSLLPPSPPCSLPLALTHVSKCSPEDSH